MLVDMAVMIQLILIGIVGQMSIPDGKPLAQWHFRSWMSITCCTKRRFCKELVLWQKSTRVRIMEGTGGLPHRGSSS